MGEKLDFILAALDSYLNDGKTPSDALSAAIEDYAFVYHTDDGRPPISRAAEIVLKRLENDDDN